MKLPLARIEEFVQGSGEFDGHLVAGGYSIDSRTLAPGQLFFAIAGERADGHEFVEAALEAGAVAAVVRQDRLARYPVKTALIAVGKNRGRSDRFDRQDDHQRRHCPRSFIASQGIEIGRQP
jgi:UDP-N-acetylmuramyl pentapeptide synthase